VRLERRDTLLPNADTERTSLTARARLASEHAATAAELIHAEQLCWPFLGFRLDLHGGAVVLTITAPNELA
jgi:hypothetical protein